MTEQLDKRTTFDVFTRIKRGDNLVHIGTIDAETAELAKVYAAYTYDEEDWVEMCVVERNQLNWVKKPKGLFAGKGA